ncbi:MAG: Rieske 2Fe-2S domain-containing protein [Chloroflexales bacterium]|nr:Rieske 2Fe-2S domain-containing protein [Chloroflexales bacterium]
MAEKHRNAGRIVQTRAEVEATAGKSGQSKSPLTASREAVQDAAVNRREFLAYAMAASTALFTVASLAFMTLPDPVSDPLLGNIVPSREEGGRVEYPVVGGFAYPRIKEGTFGGRFILTKKVDDYNENDLPELNPTGKFYVVKVSNLRPVADNSTVGAQGIMAIYQVCTHLGCLVPYDSGEKRFICPCHGSTFERDSEYVRGPAPRSMDQFAVTVADDGTITVDTGKRHAGEGQG